MAAVSGAFLMHGEAFVYATEGDNLAGWTASLLAAELLALGNQWQYMYPAFRVNGVLYPVGSYTLLDQPGSPYTPILLLWPMQVGAANAYLTPDLAKVLLALPPAKLNALVYTVLNFGVAAVTRLRPYYDPSSGQPYALEISANPLLSSPVEVMP